MCKLLIKKKKNINYEMTDTLWLIKKLLSRKICIKVTQLKKLNI